MIIYYTNYREYFVQMFFAGNIWNRLKIVEALNLLRLNLIFVLC